MDFFQWGRDQLTKKTSIESCLIRSTNGGEVVHPHPLLRNPIFSTVPGKGLINPTEMAIPKKTYFGTILTQFFGIYGRSRGQK